MQPGSSTPTEPTLPERERHARAVGATRRTDDAPRRNSRQSPRMPAAADPRHIRWGDERHTRRHANCSVAAHLGNTARLVLVSDDEVGEMRQVELGCVALRAPGSGSTTRTSNQSQLPQTFERQRTKISASACLLARLTGPRMWTSSWCTSSEAQTAAASGRMSTVTIQRQSGTWRRATASGIAEQAIIYPQAPCHS